MCLTKKISSNLSRTLLEFWFSDVMACCQQMESGRVPGRWGSCKRRAGLEQRTCAAGARSRPALKAPHSRPDLRPAGCSWQASCLCSCPTACPSGDALLRHDTVCPCFDRFSLHGTASSGFCWQNTGCQCKVLHQLMTWVPTSMSTEEEDMEVKGINSSHVMRLPL